MPSLFRVCRPPPLTSILYAVTFKGENEWGTDHFGFTYRGDLRAFCAALKEKGVRMAVEPWEFKPGLVLCYVSAPDGVSIELIQVA